MNVLLVVGYELHDEHQPKHTPVATVTVAQQHNGSLPARFVLHGRVAVDMGAQDVYHFSSAEMQNVAGAAKMAMAKVLRARRSTRAQLDILFQWAYIRSRVGRPKPKDIVDSLSVDNLPWWAIPLNARKSVVLFRKRRQAQRLSAVRSWLQRVEASGAGWRKAPQ